MILPRHRSMGLPRYVHGHHPNPLCRGFAALRKKSYRLVGEVAKLLGVSENTVRRMEAEGVIPKARRGARPGKSVRAFTAKEVERIARSGHGSAEERSIRTLEVEVSRSPVPSSMTRRAIRDLVKSFKSKRLWQGSALGVSVLAAIALMLY